MQNGTKYRLLDEAKRKGHRVRFEALYYASDAEGAILEEELGKMEGEYIRKYRPPLNTQIPKTENWRRYERKPIDVDAFRYTYIEKRE